MLLYALWYIAGFIIIECLLTITKIRINKKVMIVELILFACALSIVAYHFVPMVSDDLYRHFLSIEVLKSYSASAYAKAIYSSPLFLWKGLLQFVATLKNEHYLPAFVVGADYLIFIIIIYMVWGKYNITRGVILLFICIHFPMLQYVSIFSGLRNVFVYFVDGYILISCIFFNKKLTRYLPAILLLVFWHPAVLIPVFLYVLFKMFNESLGGYIVLIGWPVIIYFIERILQFVRLPIITLLLSKFNVYLGTSVEVDIRKRIVEFTFLVFLFLQLLICQKKGKLKEEEKEYLKFGLFICLFILIAFFYAYYIFERCMFLLGVMMLPFLIIIYRELKPYKLFLNLIYMIYIFGWNAYGLVALLSHMHLEENIH